MANKFVSILIFAVFCLMTSYATNPQTPPAAKPTTGTCPALTPDMIRCLPQYACQHVIRLDLRCLLNLNGTPLLGGLLGGTGGGGGGLLGGGLLGGGGGGGAPGGGTGLVGGLLGR